MAPTTRRASKSRRSKPPAQSTDQPLMPKRSVLGVHDDYEGSTQTTIEPLSTLLSDLDKRRLTKLDHELISIIKEYEAGSKPASEPGHGRALFEEERELAKTGEPLNCHAVIYWRFRKAWERDDRRVASGGGEAAAAGREEGAQLSPQVGSAMRKLGGLSLRSPRRKSSGAASGMTGVVRGGPSPRSAAAAAAAASSMKFVAPSKASSSSGSAWPTAGVKSPGKRPMYDGSSRTVKSPRRELPTGLQQRYSDDDDDDAMSDDIGEEADFVKDFDMTPRKGLARSPKSPSSGISPRTMLPTAPGPQPSNAAARSIRAQQQQQQQQPPLPKGRGTVETSTNPKWLPKPDGTPSNKPNPFFETLPAAEVWHRQMPAELPFGETPYMARFWSDQIEQDLKATDVRFPPVSSSTIAGKA